MSALRVEVEDATQVDKQTSELRERMSDLTRSYAVRRFVREPGGVSWADDSNAGKELTR